MTHYDYFINTVVVILIVIILAYIIWIFIVIDNDI